MKRFRLMMPPTLAGVIAVLRLLPRVSRPRTIVLTLGVAVATAFPIAFTIAAGLLVGAVPAAVRGGLDSASGHHAILLLVIAALTIAGGRIVDPLVTALADTFGRRLDRYLQERLMAAVGRPVGIQHLEDPQVRDLIATSQGIGAQDTRPGRAVASLASLLPSWLSALGSAAILIRFEWWIGLLWIALWPVVLYYLQREYIRVGQIASGEANTLRRSNYYRDLALTPGPAKEVRIWGLTDWLLGRFRESWHGAMAPVWAARKPGRAVLWTTTLVVAGMVILTLLLLLHAAIQGTIALGALAVYVQAVNGAFRFRAFDDANMELAFAAVSVPSLLVLEEQLSADTVATASSGQSQSPVGAHSYTEVAATSKALSLDSPRSGICFEGVRFHYPRADRETLDGVDLELRAGRSLAIVGANGAGKTTLVKLLCRLYEPTGGRITVDDTDLRDIDPAEWRRHVAAIYQDFTRYHLAARANVAMGALHIVQDTDRLREAARRAGALDLIEALPHGWDTVLSREYTGGTDLSGGQWQRVALARALFAVEGGARVLILDEPTANLDVRAETEIYDRFLELTAGLTTVLISHRFSTVRRAHHIVVLEGGRIVERGNHNELMARDGRYAHMFRLQAERFALEEVEA